MAYILESVYGGDVEYNYLKIHIALDVYDEYNATVILDMYDEQCIKLPACDFLKLLQMETSIISSLAGKYHLQLANENYNKINVVSSIFENRRTISSAPLVNYLNENAKQQPVHTEDGIVILTGINREYIVAILIKKKILSLKRKSSLPENKNQSVTTGIDLPIYSFFNVKNFLLPTILHKLKHIEKYSKFTFLLHHRIVDYYYVHTMMKNTPQEEVDKFCDPSYIDTFRKDLLNLESIELPSNLLKDISLEKSVCELIGSELRTINYIPIYKDICKLLLKKTEN